ncbi:MAG: hypothetical protein ABEJ99_05490 [Candidatus Nanohaloarchaea archaeon]
MVYEKKCVNCGKILDFGGKDHGNLPENAFEFEDKIYCRECVKEFVQFGTGQLNSRIESLEQEMKKVREELGLEKH